MKITKKRNFNNILLIPIIVLLFLPYSLFAETATTTVATTTANKTTAVTATNDVAAKIQAEIKKRQAETAKKQMGEILDFSNILKKGLKKVKAGYINFYTEPKYPEPNQKIKVSLVSYLFDLNRAKMRWYVNGSLYKSGIGLQNISIMSGDSGEGTSIKVIVDTIEGNTIERYTTIMPIEMTLLWEANTYTPPFYRGKALLSTQSTFKIIALPNIKLKDGKVINPSNLVYLWKGKRANDAFSDGDNSGYGKNILHAQAPLPYVNDTIKVEVSSLDNSIKSSKSIEIQPIYPSVLVYKDDPIKGVLYNDAITGNYNLKNQEIQLRAEPYYFSNKDVGNLKYKWSINDKNINKFGREITFRNESTKNIGFSNISVNIKNIYKKFQQAEDSFMLKF